MRILYGTGFSDEDRHHYVNAVHSNTISCMRTLCEQAAELGNSSSIRCQAEYTTMIDYSDQSPLTEEIGNMIHKLWRDAAIQKTWESRSDYQIIESNASYFKSLGRISAFEYLPTDEDILTSRVRTTGIVEEVRERTRSCGAYC